MSILCPGCATSVFVCILLLLATTTIVKIRENLISPAQIRTGVKGSKGLYAWPLHSANYKFSTGLPDDFFMEHLIYKDTNLPTIFSNLFAGSSIRFSIC